MQKTLKKLTEARIVLAVGMVFLGCTSQASKPDPGSGGWNPNQAQYASATALTGPWSSLANIGDGNTFDSQSTYEIPVAGSETTTYIYGGDRW
jgi:hypothetical protein